MWIQFIHIKAGLESEVAKAAIKLRNTFIAAETMIVEDFPFWFLFFGFKEKRFLLQRKKIP